MASSTTTFTSFPSITMDKLKGSENYASWSASVKLWFKGQGMSDHLDTKVKDIEEKKDEWEKVDALLCNMLWQSIDPKLHNIYKSFETCYDVWNKAKSLYTNDVQQLYSLISNMLNFRGTVDMNIPEFLGRIEALRQEYNNLMPHEQTAEGYVKQCDKFFMVFTLATLRPDMVHVRDQILASPDVPTLTEASARLLRVTVAPSIEPSGDSSVLASRTTDKGPFGPSAMGGTRRGNRSRCEYCHKVGHTKDRCWKLHGKPPHPINVVQVAGSEKQAHSSSSTPIEITPTEFEEYLQLKASRPDSSTSSPNAGTSSMVCLSKTGTPSTWILDSGASDHISDTQMRSIEEDDDGPPPGWQWNPQQQPLPESIPPPGLQSAPSSNIQMGITQEDDDGPPPGWQLISSQQKPPQTTPPLLPQSVAPSDIEKENKGGNKWEIEWRQSGSESSPMQEHSSTPTRHSSVASSDIEMATKQQSIKNEHKKLCTDRGPTQRMVTRLPPAALQISSEVGQLVCGTCRQLLSYPRGSKWVQCSACQTVNLALEGHQIGQVKCGGCTVLLMYQYGAPSVKCSSCHFVTRIGAHNRRPHLAAQQARRQRPSHQAH